MKSTVMEEVVVLLLFEMTAVTSTVVSALRDQGQRR